MTVSIVSPSAAAVKPRRHPRFRREDIPAPEIDPVLKAFGRHIARSFHRGRGVHIPAMKNTAFGQVLRTLELKRVLTDEVSLPREGRQQTEGEHFMTSAAITMTAPEAASPVQMYRATYSPDDNKLRLYAVSRLDPETYKKVHDAGFRWAPKYRRCLSRQLDTGREDVLLSLAGEIRG